MSINKGLEKKLFVSCNGPQKNKVLGNLVIFLFFGGRGGGITLLFKNVCFIQVLC